MKGCHWIGIPTLQRDPDLTEKLPDILSSDPSASAFQRDLTDFGQACVGKKLPRIMLHYWSGSLDVSRQFRNPLLNPGQALADLLAFGFEHLPLFLCR